MELVTEKYKQTEQGLIPWDWQVKELGTILTFGSGKDYKHLENGEIPVYGTGGVMTYVDEFLFDGESVGIGRKGTIDKPVFLEGKFWTVDTLFYTHQFTNANPKFIYYKFCLIKWKEYNEASGVPSLNKNTLQKIKIALPELAEQTAIANALSDADALISSLEKLIAKKRNIKQGAMQKLLEPKDGWEVKKLGEVCAYQNGKSLEQYFNSKDGLKVISIGNYSPLGKFVITNTFIDRNYESKVKKFILKKDDLTMILNDKTAVGSIIGRVLLIDEDDRFVFNQRTMRLTCKSNYCPLFIYYKFRTTI